MELPGNSKEGQWLPGTKGVRLLEDRFSDRDGVFEKMRASQAGKPNAGFRPIGEIKDGWHGSKYDAAGTVVAFAYLGPAR